jgi:hypothetical protein
VEDLQTGQSAEVKVIVAGAPGDNSFLPTISEEPLPEGIMLSSIEPIIDTHSSARKLWTVKFKVKYRGISEWSGSVVLRSNDSKLPKITIPFHVSEHSTLRVRPPCLVITPPAAIGPVCRLHLEYKWPYSHSSMVKTYALDRHEG